MSRIPKLKANDKVEILWHDAHACGDDSKQWHGRDECLTASTPYEVLSVGYFVKRTKDMVYIAGDFSGPDVSRVFGIPVGCIKAVKKL